jgi:hypothetical protein
MKVETKLSLEGKTKIVEANNFPLKIEFFKEVNGEAVRQYICLVKCCWRF